MTRLARVLDSRLVLLIVLLTALPALADERPTIANRGNIEISSEPHGYVAQTYEQRGGAICNFINFEPLCNSTYIGTIPGSPDVMFGPDWLSIVDADAFDPCGPFWYGTGNFANEPSANTAAFFLDLPVPPAINFSSGVQFIELWYTARADSIPVTLRAWNGLDGTGSVVATAVGNTVGTDFDGAPCSGDPTGAYCLWDVMTVRSPSNNIRSITFSGAVENAFAFDNMTFCVTIPATGACCLAGGGCQVITEENCASQGGAYRGDDSICDACQGCDPPVVTLQPVSQVICAGGAFTFSTAAQGTDPISYQWRFNGVGIPGATADRYTLDPAFEVHTGTYDIVVTDACGSVISDAATAIAWPTGTADANGDGLLNGLDVSTFLSVIMTRPNGPAGLDFCGCDMNADGTVNYDDVPLLIAAILGL